MKDADIAYAVVRVGGKQYKVATGDVIVVDRIHADEGKHVTLEPLAVRGAGDESEVGANVSAKVRAKVTEHFLGEKIQVFTYKPKKTFKKKHGHRSRLSRLAIESISVKERKESKSGA